MSKKSKSLVIYGAVVAVVVGYALFDNWSSQREEESKKAASKILLLEKDQVSKLKLKLKTDTIELEKTVDGWKMAAPFKDIANNGAVEDYIEGIVTELSSGIAAESNIDKKVYGLDPAKAEIVLVTNAGKEQKISVGSAKNFQGNSYLQINDEQKILIGSPTWFTKAEKTAMEFRDRRLMRLSNAKTDAVSIRSPKGQFDLVKKDSEWKIKGHEDWKLDQNKVRELINKFNITEAIEFIGDGKPALSELKKWGFESGKETVFETYSEGKRTWSARISSGEDKVSRAIVSSPEFILKVSPADLASFKLSPDAYRDRSEPFQFEKDKAEKIVVQWNDQKVELSANSEKAHAMIGELQKLELDKFEKATNEKLENYIEILDKSGLSKFKFQWSKALEISDETSTRTAVYAKSSAYAGTFSLLEAEIDSLKISELFPAQVEKK